MFLLFLAHSRLSLFVVQSFFVERDSRVHAEVELVDRNLENSELEGFLKAVTVAVSHFTFYFDEFCFKLTNFVFKRRNPLLF